MRSMANGTTAFGQTLKLESIVQVIFARFLTGCAGVTVTSISPAKYLAERRGDVLTTGSIGPRGGWGLSRTQRAIDSSAKGGNAAQPNFLVPQYGNTAGGPAQ